MDYFFGNKSNCCGCSACENICPKHAIDFKFDELGYAYPNVNDLLCIKCNLCKKICQFSKSCIQDANNEVVCYAAKNKDLNIVKQSRSAGVFTAISDYVLDNKGVVYGAKLDEDFFVRHHRATNNKERDNFRKSKYVQSIVNGVFNKVLEDLNNNLLVMFSGTGCQCDGLVSYIKEKKGNLNKLILVDIVCHGVPSPIMFREYINWIENSKNIKIVDFQFRDKNKYKWCDGIEKITFDNNNVVYQDYFTGFIFDNFVRPSCYNCKYTTPYRNSDITLADFWGVENTFPEFMDLKNGCSLVLIHSKKGVNIFDNIKDKIFYKETSVDKCLQPRLISSRDKKNEVINLEHIYVKKGFDFLIETYGVNNVTFYNRVILRVLNFMKRFFHKIGLLTKLGNYL